MEELAYHEVGNDRIAGVFHSASGNDRRLVVMAHGFKGSKIGPSRYFVTLARDLALRGISVFRFDQPGSGDSSGAFEESSFSRWISTIIYFAKIHHQQGFEIALLGQSMGGVATLAAAADLGIATVRGIALWSASPEDPEAPLSLADDFVEEDGQRVRKQYWLEAHSVDFLGLYRRLSVPVFMVYGTNDHLIPMERVKSVQRACKPTDRILIVDGLPHSAWPFEARMSILAQTADFFVQVLNT